jgi:ComEC/Rec2-related protein
MTRLLTPAFYVALGVLAVIFTQTYIPLLLFTGCSVILAALGITAWYSADESLKHKGLALICLGAGFFLGNLLAANLGDENTFHFTGTGLERIGRFDGFLQTDEQWISDDLSVCSLKLTSAATRDGTFTGDARGEVRLFVRNSPGLYAGETLTVEGRLKPNKDTDPGFADSWVTGDKVRINGFSSWVYAARFSVIGWCGVRIAEMGEPQASFFKALFLGDRRGLEPELQESLFATGSVHLLAVSGLHVGIVFTFIALVLFPFHSKKIKIIIGSLCVLCYLFLVGPKPSLLRASVMIVTAGTAVVLDRDFNPYNVFFLSLVIALWLDPGAAATLSFGLSYCAVLGMLTMGAGLNSYLTPYLPAPLRAPLSFSLGAQAATLPLVIIFFKQVYVLAFLAALILVPLVTAFVWGGMTFLIISIIPFTPLHQAAAAVLTIVYRIIFSVSGFFAKIPVLVTEWNNWYIVPLVLLAGLVAFIIYRERSYEL